MPPKCERGHEPAQAHEVESAAGEVEALAGATGALFDQQAGGGDRADHADRDVEPEHGRPAEARQPATEDRAEDEPGADDHRVHAERPAELAARERVRDEGGRVGHQERATDALDEPTGDQQRRIRGEGAPDRGEREQREAGGVRAGPPDAIRDAARAEHEDRRHQRVPDDDPEEAEEVGLEVAQDVRECDHEGPGRQRGEQGADARDPQDDPAVAVGRLARDRVSGARAIRVRHGRIVPQP